MSLQDNVRPYPAALPIIGLLLCLSLFAFNTQAFAAEESLPDRIVAQRGGFIPEGIDYDNRNGRLLSGSLSEGTIFQISGTGRLTPLVEDPLMSSSVGIEIDEPRNRVLAAIADLSTPSGAAGLGVFALDSGQRLAQVDLVASIEDRPADASHFANDVAVSRYGVAFVTDTRMNIIYEVDIYYNATVLLNLGPDSGFDFNGIEYHPAGYLLVASPGTGQILRVPVNSPDNWELVELNFPATGADGLVWANDGTLVATSNNTSSVLKYRSEDNWRTARLVGMASFEGQGTTAAVVGDDVYVVQPQFSNQQRPVILRARF